MTHGTTTRYSAGCRCDLCRGAFRLYQQDYRATRKVRHTAPHVRRDPTPQVRREPLDDWQQKAACAAANPSIFNGPDTNLQAALPYCSACPVRAECFQFGRRDRAATGIYGGVLFQDGRVVDHLVARAARMQVAS